MCKAKKASDGNHLERGRRGESMAAKFLKKSGLRLVKRNYKTEIGEIDLIAVDDETLVFIEVKSRRTTDYGAPAEAVTYRKQRKIVQVAAQYIKQHMLQGVAVRFDVLEVYLSENRVNHIQNAFDSYLSF